MKFKKCLLLFTTVFFLCSLFSPGASTALTVNNASGASCSEPDCYTSISAAISALSGTTTSAVVITLLPGEYSETLTLPATPAITLEGQETASALLYSTITATAGSHTIQNLTIAVNGATGISITDTASVTIRNNLFWDNNIAVSIAAGSSSGGSINNNVFYGNGVGVDTDVDLQIRNNIFMSNSSASISSGTISSFTQVTYNNFYSNPDDATWSPSGNTNNNISSDPLFVNYPVNDFHLETLSPCQDTGYPGETDIIDSTTSDIGAYGGPYADTIPFIVSGITATSASTSAAIDVTWSANNSYLVSRYNVYYGTATGVYDSYVAVDGATTTTTTLSSLSSTTTVPDAPVLNQPSVANGVLNLSWSAVSGATGYRVYYDTDDGTSSPPATKIDVGDTTSYALSGLTNNLRYKVAVSAISQTTYYIAVTALNSGGSSYSPGTSYESAYSEELSVGVGDTGESALSNTIIDFPEALVAYPNLPDKRQGCFIATAAYGYYSAPEVQALRNFRDRYLLTNRPGSAFVRWYYEHGPVGAAYLDAHPASKPLVRAALLPAVGAALFMTKTSLFEKVLAMLCILSIALITAYRFSRKRFSGSGGIS